MLEDLQLDSIKGLRPQARLCLGPSYSREDVKAKMFESGGGLLSHALCSVEDLAWERLGIDKAPLLDRFTIEECVRSQLSHPAVQAHSEKIWQDSTERSFASRLARTLVRSRESFAHEAELEVYLERLEQAKQPSKSEWVFLVTYWEKWLESQGLWDRPRLLKEAAARPASEQTILRLDARELVESRESSFWETLPHHRIGTSGAFDEPLAEPDWTLHHGWDDATDALAERLTGEEDLSRHAIVMVDQPPLRRSLLRSLSKFGVVLMDARDPTEIRTAEWVKELTERAFDELPRVSLKLGDLVEWALKWQKSADWNAFWTAWQKAWEPIRALDFARTPAEWKSLTRERWRQQKPGALREWTPSGIALYRPEQRGLNLGKVEHLWVLGLSAAEWDRPVGDAFLSDRDRMILGGEFQVMSVPASRQQKQSAWKEWFSGRSVHIVDAATDHSGREREGAYTALKELGLGVDLKGAKTMGVYASRESSYDYRPWSAPSKIRLGPHGRKQLSVSELDLYSRCGFQALGRYRWKVEDSREDSVEFRPEFQGTLMHHLAERLIQKFGNHRLDAVRLREWIELEVRSYIQKNPPQGWRESARVLDSVLDRWTRVFARFIEKENKYRETAKALPLALEKRFQWTEPQTEIQLRGILDRMDENEAGELVLADYKTGGSLPNGLEMVEKGYRLQLGATALAMQDQLRRPVVAAHFIGLNTAANRSRGIFVNATREWISHSGVRKKNVFEDGAVWDRIRLHLKEHLELWSQGVWDAKPKDLSECDRCSWFDSCGRGRREASD